MVQRKQTRWTRFIRAMRSETAQKWSHRAPALLVAGVALYVSFWHISEVVNQHTHDLVTPLIMPLSVDGLLIVSARYVTRAKTPLGRISALAGFFLGMVATLAGNLLTSDGTPVGYGVSTWPAVAVIVTGVILHWGDAKPKSGSRAGSKAPAKAPVKATERRTPAIPTASTPNGAHAVTDVSTAFVSQTA